MAEPRCVVPNQSHFVTRRCGKRTFGLTPNQRADRTNHIIRYALGLAQQKTGVELHAVCAMSDHTHAEMTDREGRYPEFLREAHRTIAKAVNASRGEWESLWSSEKTHVAPIADDLARMDRIAYIATNPVDAELVAEPEDWPGVLHWRPGVMRIPRPKVYFDPKGRCPDFVELRFTRPPLPAGMTAREWDAALERKIEQRVAAALERMKRGRRRFVGRTRVLAGSLARRAASQEQRRAPIPRVAASEPRAKRRLLLMRREFLVKHRLAKARWCAGDREALFPYGTWWMRVHHAARVDEPPKTRA